MATAGVAMGNEMDRSCQINEDFQEFALGQQRKSRNEANYVSTGINCVGCGEEIPEGRRIAMPGCRLCVDCQAGEEREIHQNWSAL